HEAVDDAMEDRVVVVAGADVLQEIRDRCRCVFGVELELDVAVVGVQDDHGDSYLASPTYARVTMTGVAGTSPGLIPCGTGPDAPFGAVAILLTTSIPSTTLPKTV